MKRNRGNYFKEYYAKNKADKLKKVAQYADANRAKISEYQSEYRKSEAGKAAMLKADTKRKNNPVEAIKLRARYIVRHAVRDGLIKKLPCRICGNMDSEAHHEDYNQPLKVEWVCRKHHKELHGRPK